MLTNRPLNIIQLHNYLDRRKTSKAEFFTRFFSALLRGPALFSCKRKLFLIWILNSCTRYLSISHVICTLLVIQSVQRKWILFQHCDLHQNARLQFTRYLQATISLSFSNSKNVNPRVSNWQFSEMISPDFENSWILRQETRKLSFLFMEIEFTTPNHETLRVTTYSIQRHLLVCWTKLLVPAKHRC